MFPCKGVTCQRGWPGPVVPGTGGAIGRAELPGSGFGCIAYWGPRRVIVTFWVLMLPEEQIRKRVGESFAKWSCCEDGEVFRRSGFWGP